MNSEINTYSNSFLGNFGIPLRCALCVHVYVVQGTNLLFYFILVTKTNFNFN